MSTAKTEWLLYHTLGCHLCDDAEALLKQAGFSYQKFDIIEDETLVDSFGEMIPVLLHSPSNQYIAWPFDAALIQEFTQHITELKQAQAVIKGGMVKGTDSVRGGNES
jgi:hypothetical protein